MSQPTPSPTSSGSSSRIFGRVGRRCWRGWSVSLCQCLDWPGPPARFAKTARASPSKIRHPGIGGSHPRDFKTARSEHFSLTLAVAGANVEGFVAEAEARFLEECDYRLEARRQIRFGRDLRRHASITIPASTSTCVGPRVPDLHLARRRDSMPFSHRGLRSGESPGGACPLRILRPAHSTATGSSTPITPGQPAFLPPMPRDHPRSRLACASLRPTWLSASPDCRERFAPTMPVTFRLRCWPWVTDPARDFDVTRSILRGSTHPA